MIWGPSEYFEKRSWSDPEFMPLQPERKMCKIRLSIQAFSLLTWSLNLMRSLWMPRTLWIGKRDVPLTFPFFDNLPCCSLLAAWTTFSPNHYPVPPLFKRHIAFAEYVTLLGKEIPRDSRVWKQLDRLMWNWRLCKQGQSSL